LDLEVFAERKKDIEREFVCGHWMWHIYMARATGR
jgi:hypothetical protein